VNVFFDCEFHDLVKTPKLISIGLVSEDSLTFYAELSDTYEIDECSAFVQEIVLPLLEGGEVLMTRHLLRGQLKDWLESFGETVTLATDSLSWDWPRIHELFPTSESWPANLVRSPALLNMNHLRDFDKFGPAVERAFAFGLRRHHALDDAKANREGFIAAGGIWEAPKPRGRFTV
jgi:hypothetical protein